MKILAISVGLPKTIRWNNKDISTSIYKTPVSGSVLVKKENIEGDRQADLTVHGGFDKAIYAYSYEAYPWWQQQLGLDEMPFGSLGENLTFDTLDEAQIFVGDIFEIGTCELQAVQPRMPCFKLGIKYNNLKVIKMFNDFHRSGVYFRVNKEGTIKAGDSLKLISSESIKASISELFQIAKDKGVTTKVRARELAKIQSLNEEWRNGFIQISQEND